MALLPRVAAAAPLAPFKLFDSHPHFHADDLVKYPYRVDIEPARRARAVARPVTPDMLFERWDEAEVELGCGVQFNALFFTANRYLLVVAEQYPERDSPGVLLLPDCQRVVEGTSVQVRVNLGGPPN